jgi:hypothetical protein
MHGLLKEDVKKVEKGVAVLGAGEIELRLHNDSARVW